MLGTALAVVASLAACVVGTGQDAPHHGPLDVNQPYESMMYRRQSSATTWPYGPLRTRGRDIVNSRGDVITLAGVSWPLSGKMALSNAYDTN